MFYFEGELYKALNSVSEDELKVIVNFVNTNTDDIIETGDLSKKNNKK